MLNIDTGVCSSTVSSLISTARAGATLTSRALPLSQKWWESPWGTLLLCRLAQLLEQPPWSYKVHEELRYFLRRTLKQPMKRPVWWGPEASWQQLCVNSLRNRPYSSTPAFWWGSLWHLDYNFMRSPEPDHPVNVTFLIPYSMKLCEIMLAVVSCC